MLGEVEGVSDFNQVKGRRFAPAQVDIAFYALKDVRGHSSSSTQGCPPAAKMLET
jgi:hypothetical protein